MLPIFAVVSHDTLEIPKPGQTDHHADVLHDCVALLVRRYDASTVPTQSQEQS